ncbi:TPA: TraB/GumN family protein [Enterococcus faecalis]|uniref:TraB/GumN family protein n=1 Tax=Enterococcus faecalis TaxID=1351 RepID=UPI000CF2DACD|nr:TraB/GumN family protein [Enterococcus faecalis]EKZ0055423.1 TraB/GumN family protein [Enterococcus faecalis]EKZ0493426.1 TraB/GumN family protein [Enterococcus faecalis]PQG27033.1 TraB family protein [Enterococcus faecalis]HAP4917329.1 TraB/GumN family protein [Enterococcus faecalis]HAP5446105.1 TraB/GumN family protein [Enterococcus faecalis]
MEIAMDGVEKLVIQDKTYYLVGTNHISEESAKLVKNVIDEVRPGCVCVELDQKRHQKYTSPEEWAKTDIIKIIKQNKLVVLFSNIVYGALQRKLAKEKGTIQAGELIQALESAEDVGADIQLIDRDIQVTFKRMWRHLSFTQKPKLIMTFFSEFEDVETERLEDFLESDSFDNVFIQLSKKFPTIYNDMITERDKVMVTNLQNSKYDVNVVVVGKAHINGIKAKLKEEKSYDISELTSIPSKKLSSKLIELIFPLTIILLLAVSFFSGVQVGFHQLLKWWVWNGGLAAIFTCFALPSPLTILTSLIMAPVGALSPVLSVGVFSALAEATVKKPTVRDFLTVQDDFLSIKTIYSNRLIKIGLVFLLSNLGGAIGNIIGGIGILNSLF